jgi:hypothetical protein
LAALHEIVGCHQLRHGQLLIDHGFDGTF